MAAAVQTTSLTVSYTLSPPEETNSPPSLLPSGAHAFAVEAEKTASYDVYYAALRKSIATAKEKLGEELTTWRDAIGNAEVGKENVSKAARAEDEEGEEEEEEEEESRSP